MNDGDLSRPYRRSVLNRVDVLRSDACGCFRCLAIFDPSTIRSWVDTGQTAVCPKCGMDSVLGDASGFALTDELLGALQQQYFPAARSA
jgi:hypothetical protein